MSTWICLLVFNTSFSIIMCILLSFLLFIKLALLSWYCSWAIVKDVAVAKKMGLFIEINTIGVSQDAQVRGAGLIRATMKAYKQKWIPNGHDKSVGGLLSSGKFFDYGKVIMEARWKAVREALSGSKNFSVPMVNDPATCKFLGTSFSTNAGQSLHFALETTKSFSAPQYLF